MCSEQIPRCLLDPRGLGATSPNNRNEPTYEEKSLSKRSDGAASTRASVRRRRRNEVSGKRNARDPSRGSDRSKQATVRENMCPRRAACVSRCQPPRQRTTDFGNPVETRCARGPACAHVALGLPCQRSRAEARDFQISGKSKRVGRRPQWHVRPRVNTDQRSNITCYNLSVDDVNARHRGDRDQSSTGVSRRKPEYLRCFPTSRGIEQTGFSNASKTALKAQLARFCKVC